MIKYKTIHKLLLLCIACCLSGCLGGTVAQQIARTVVTKLADKAVATAMDVDEDAPARAKRKSVELKDTVPDGRWVALSTGKFKSAQPEQPTVQTAPKEEKVKIAKANQLVQVELYNHLLAEEKTAIFEKARLIGSLNLPQKREWTLWHVATGSLNEQNELITFLIPPHFGKLPSGSVAVVELAQPGNLNIARYVE